MRGDVFPAIVADKANELRDDDGIVATTGLFAGALSLTRETALALVGVVSRVLRRGRGGMLTYLEAPDSSSSRQIWKAAPPLKSPSPDHCF